MKIVLVGDIHIGARNDNLIFADYHISFFMDQLFPYMKENNLKVIWQFGDIFDRRKFINFTILDKWKKTVFQYMVDNDITMHVLIGNHDTTYRNTNDVNSPFLLLKEYPNVITYSEHTDVQIGDTTVAIIPWINSTNEESTMKYVKKTKATVAFMHAEFGGFEMDKGHKHEGGTSSTKFKKFDTVLSGHFHHKSDNGHVYYLGIPYQITWIDHDSQKGFHLWDTDTLDLTFIHNTDIIFNKIIYDDDGEVEDYWKTLNVDAMGGKYVKVVVVNKKDLYGFDRFMTKLYSLNPAELKIIENTTDFDAENVHDEDLKIEDTAALLTQYIDAVDTDLDKDKLKKFVNQLYTEALHLEEI